MGGVIPALVGMLLLAQANPPATGTMTAAARHYDARADIRQHGLATELFATAAAAAPTQMLPQLWCARTSYYAGHRHRDDHADEMARLLALGVPCGKRLLSRFANDYDAALWGRMIAMKHEIATSLLPSLKRLEQTTAFLENMIAKHPKRFEAYALVGALYRELPAWPISIGDKQRALELFSTGIGLAPDNAEMLLGLGETHLALGDKRAARRTLLRCAQDGTGPKELEFETDEARRWASKLLSDME